MFEASPTVVTLASANESKLLKIDLRTLTAMAIDPNDKVLQGAWPEVEDRDT